MGVARWKITIGRPRKTSSAVRIFLRLSRRGKARQGDLSSPGLSRARIARTGHLFREKLRNLIAAFITSMPGLSLIRLHFFMGLSLRRTSFFTRSDNNLSPPRNHRLRDAVSLSSFLLWALCYN